MLSKKIKNNFNTLLTDIKTYGGIYKKKLKMKDYRSVESFINIEIDQLFDINKELGSLRDKLELIFIKLEKHNRPVKKLTVPKKSKKKKRRMRIENEKEIKEPNENLINNKNILSGGGWETNRRKH